MRHRPGPAARHRPAPRPRGRRGVRLLAAGVLGVALLAVSPVSAVAPAGELRSPSAASALQAEPRASLVAGPVASSSVRKTVPARGRELLCGGTADGRRPGAGDGLGRLGPAVVSWACDPFAAVAGLQPTVLEAEEPERLYALVTREQAVEPLEYAPDDLVPLFGGPYQAREEVADQLELLVKAAEEADHPVYVTSGFRDHATQAGTYEDWVRRSGAQEADRVSARPGHSEHQLGLAVDLTGSCGGFACFGESPEGQWVADNAHRFGFIIRYPEGGREVTGYAYEPWHLRYVGPRAAWAMHVRGEAYWDTFAPVALRAAGVER